MEFWGVEVTSGKPLLVEPKKQEIVHISIAALGERKNSGNEPVCLYIKVGGEKLLIGTLSHDKFPQLITEIVLERSFELSHSWKDGSVFFSGYKVDTSESDSDTDDDEPAAVATKPAVEKSGVKQVNFQLPNEDAKAKQDDDDGDDSAESDDDTSSDDSEDEEEEKKVTAEVDDSEEDDDDEEDSSDDEEDESSDEETPEKVKESKKRPAEANPASNKKAKFVTPQKTETNKPHVHVATPHPSKQGGKNSGSNGESSKQKQQQTPKSAGAFGCKSCNRTFTSEMGLQSHTKAKHSAAA